MPPSLLPETAFEYDVSIVICTRNRGAELTAFLTGVGAADVPEGRRVELVMIDNGSTDATAQLIAETTLPNVDLRYVFAPDRGKSRAFNAGVKSARGRVLLLSDDDVLVPRNWVEEMCGPILSGAADVVQGGVRLAPHLNPPWLKGVLRIWVAAVEDPDFAPIGVVGANVAMSRAAFDAVGPYDERLGPGAAGFFEDTVLGLALEKAGFKKLFRPEISVEHHFRPDRLTLRSFMATAQSMAVSRVVADRQIDPNLRKPSVWALLVEVPGLAIRCLTQLAHLATDGHPDAGFISRYYRLKLWQERHRAV